MRHLRYGSQGLWMCLGVILAVSVCVAAVRGYKSHYASDSQSSNASRATAPPRNLPLPASDAANSARDNHRENIAIEAEVPPNVINRVLAATVYVSNRSRGASGSGVIVFAGPRHVYAMTAAHLAELGETVEVSIFESTDEKRDPNNKTEFNVAAETIASSSVDDIAILRMVFDGSSLMSIRPAPLDESIHDSTTVVAAGYRDAMTRTSFTDVVRSRLVRRNQTEQPIKLWQGEKAGFSGQSGGPLVDARGYLIGLRSGIAHGDGYYAHFDAIKKILEHHQLNWLGVAKERQSIGPPMD